MGQTRVRPSGSGVAAEFVEADQMQGEVLDPVKQAVEPGIIADRRIGLALC